MFIFNIFTNVYLPLTILFTTNNPQFTRNDVTQNSNVLETSMSYFNMANEQIKRCCQLLTS